MNNPAVLKKARERKPAPARQSSQKQVVEGFRQALIDGKHWYVALLEAIGKWTAVEERWRGRDYHYLIGGEAFDWLTLAERLCLASNGLVPVDERDRLLFYGMPPLEFTREQFRDILGFSKYQALLNYWYGVVVEEALLLVAEEAIRKEKGLWLNEEDDIEEEAYGRIYGERRETLFESFQKDVGCTSRDRLSFAELKEFTYWLSKYRLLRSDGARLASDTSRAVKRLEELRAMAGNPHGLINENVSSLLNAHISNGSLSR